MTFDAESLCLGCGLCCNGSLFLHTSLRADEAPPFLARRLPVLQNDGHLQALQPCGFHQDERYSVYENRPDTCSRFQCTAFARLQAGELSLAAASQQVAQVKIAISELELALGWPTGSYSLSAYEAWWEKERRALGDAQARKAHAHVALKAGMLRILILKTLGARTDAARVSSDI